MTTTERALLTRALPLLVQLGDYVDEELAADPQRPTSRGERCDLIGEIKDLLEQPTQPVYVLFHETNSGHSEVSDGYVEAVYATEELAEAAKLAAIRQLVADGQDVYWNPDTEEEGPDDWTDDFQVQAFQVRITPELADRLELAPVEDLR